MGERRCSHTILDSCQRLSVAERGCQDVAPANTTVLANVPQGPTDIFGCLKTVLNNIITTEVNQEVRLRFIARSNFLTDFLPICRE